MPLSIAASRKLRIPHMASVPRSKRPRTAGRSMVSSHLRTAGQPGTTAPNVTPTDTESPFAVPPADTTPINPQTQSPIFSLARQLRDMIYVYAFTSNLNAPTNGSPPTVELGALPIAAPSSGFLLTCRQVEDEATAFHRAAQRSFCKDNVFSIDLSDDWERLSVPKERHFEVLDLLDERFFFSELSDAQIDAMENLVINVRSDIGNCQMHLESRTSPGGAYWRLDQNASSWDGASMDILTNGHYPHRTLITALHATVFPERNRLYLMFAHRHFHITSLRARGASGRRHKSMSASREMLVKLESRRAVLVAKPPSVHRSGTKKRQLEALLEHCWIIWRTRRVV